MRSILPIVRAAMSLPTLLRASSLETVTLSPLTSSLPLLLEGHRRVFLLRHGETDWNAKGLMQGGGFDIELNEDGKLQADKAREALAGLSFGVIVSSHLARSESTADTIAQSQPQAVRIVNHRFGEMRFGDFEGHAIRGPQSTAETRDRFDEYAKLVRSDRTFAWPGGGESVNQVEERATAGLEQILTDFTCENYLIVAHGRTNKILLASLLGQREAEIGHQGNTCINVFDVDMSGNCFAHVINYVGHIENEWE